MLATIIDWDALWKIFLVVLAVGVGGTALFGQGVISYERRSGVLDYAVVGLTAIVCAGVLVVGFIAMTHK
jgi:hypothetical protein